MPKNFLLPGLLLLGALALLVFVLLGPGAAPLRETPPAPVEGARPASASTLGTGEPAVAREIAPSTRAAAPPTASAVRQSQALPGGSAPEVAAPVDAAAAEALRDAKLESITEAFYTFSPEGLKVLEPLLQDPDPEVREAAVEGIQQLSVPEGIPVLKRAASRARNEEERRRLLQAAEWLALPDWVPPSQRAQKN